MSWFTFNVDTRMGDAQFAWLQNALNKQKQEMERMALNLDGLNAAVAALQEDLSQVAAKVDALKNNASDPADQAAIDDIAAKLAAIDAGLDAITQDAANE